MQYCVGFCLHSKKAQRYLTEQVMSLAQEKGLEIKAIDRTMPLHQQGPFDVIVHKCIADKDWEYQLTEYSVAHPEVMIVDPIDRIKILRNRTTMLSLLPKLHDGLVHVLGDIRVFVPRQVEVPDQTCVEETEQKLLDHKVQFPLLMKHEYADGRPGSHMLGFVRDRDGLDAALDPQSNSMKLPFIAQQIIPHDSVIYKVYVVGSSVHCYLRPSLDMSKCLKPFQLLPRISSKSTPLLPESIELPPKDLTQSLADLLKDRLELQLFNFDLIKESGTDDVYYIVDINYFPGIDKIENFEQIFVDFLLNICQQH